MFQRIKALNNEDQFPHTADDQIRNRQDQRINYTKKSGKNKNERIIKETNKERRRRKIQERKEREREEKYLKVQGRKENKKKMRELKDRTIDDIELQKHIMETNSVIRYREKREKKVQKRNVNEMKMCEIKGMQNDRRTIYGRYIQKNLRKPQERKNRKGKRLIGEIIISCLFIMILLIFMDKYNYDIVKKNDVDRFYVHSNILNYENPKTQKVYDDFYIDKKIIYFIPF